MKAYFLPVLLLLLVGCNDKNQVSVQQPTSVSHPPRVVQQPMQQPVMPTTRITPVNTLQPPPNPLLAQHLQESASADPMSYVVGQSMQAVAKPIEQELKESFGTEVKTVKTDFNGQQITFQYQVWQVRRPSVCANLKYDIALYSTCTQAARGLFQNMCSELKQLQNPPLRMQQFQNMYCKAAREFKPTVAQISHSKAAGDSRLKGLRKTCNDRTFTAMISEKDADIKARDKACAAYKKAAGLE